MRGRMTAGARIEQLRPGMRRLSIPAQDEERRPRYQVAQLDDYAGRRRSEFPWQAPAALQVSARISGPGLPGTWGFGWWNDPFSVSIGMGGAGRRLPALPNAAWFIHAAPPNHLALYDTHPAAGFLAASFSSPRLPWPLLAFSVPALPLLGVSLTARWLRRASRCIVREDAAVVDVDPTQMHRYRIEWELREVRFLVDDALISRTSAVPRGPMGAVLWIDNQYMGFPPDGKARFGTLSHPGGWLDLRDMELA
jgi:hypothetical protein